MVPEMTLGGIWKPFCASGCFVDLLVVFLLFPLPFWEADTAFSALDFLF
jgi:hypothetical protein